MCLNSVTHLLQRSVRPDSSNLGPSPILMSCLTAYNLLPELNPPSNRLREEQMNSEQRAETNIL